MVKKILLGVLFTALAGALVTGAVIRTQDKVDPSASQVAANNGQGRSSIGQGRNEVEANGRGQGRAVEANVPIDCDRQGLGTERNAQSVGNAGSDARGKGQKGGAEPSGEAGAAIDWLILSGVVSDVSEDALVIELDPDGLLTIEGRTWSFIQEQGFEVEVGDGIEVRGFYEDGEFKVSELETLGESARSIAIRSDGGRPNWAGQGRGGK